MKCKICGAQTRETFRHLVLRKYDVQYAQCDACGFLSTEQPYWLAEAYADAIVSADTGILQRNRHLSNVASVIFWRLFRGQGRYLDTAGGYGIFTRLMRDIGFDYYWDDPNAANLVARGYEGNQQFEPYSAITAFEVLEHLVDPLPFLADLIRRTKTLLVSTELFTGAYPAPEDWWYYAFDAGQHISFYRRSTLEIIAEKLGLQLRSSRGIHLWSTKTLSAVEFRILTHHRYSALFSQVPKSRLKSKVWSDHHERSVA